MALSARLRTATLLLVALCTVVVPVVSTTSATPAFPLSTSSRWIVDSTGKRVKFACANWSGGEEKDFVVGGLDHQPVDSIAATFASFGFNCIRLLWSVEAVTVNSVVRADRLSANPDLVGSTVLQVFDAVIAALGKHGLMVILDNHMSTGDWCCSETDGNGLWYTDAWPEKAWLSAWTTMAARTKGLDWVVAAELRNELRCATVGGKYLCPTWGDGVQSTDWKAAVLRATPVVLAANPDLVIFVDGLQYSTDFTAVYSSPLPQSEFPNKFVYCPHDYSFSQGTYTDYNSFHTYLGDQWGFILEQGKPYTAPLVITEFGTPHDGSQMGNNTWWDYFTRFISANEGADIDWGYWRGDGTESNGTSRTFGAPAWFGVLDPTWSEPAYNGVLLHALQPLMAPGSGPTGSGGQ